MNCSTSYVTKVIVKENVNTRPTLPMQDNLIQGDIVIKALKSLKYVKEKKVLEFTLDIT